ncbi:MAG: SRPBCC family protein [Halofilum sp. (in: g-proteobacteria)]|nr:SRPBCC family protein [Halofilum sp. (in: g-proteobacteria)]
MIRAQSSTAIERPVDDVFDFVVVRFFDNYPRWSPEVVELEPLDSGPLGVGSRGRQIRIDQGRRSETTFRVTRLEPQRRVEFDGERDARFAIRYHFDPEGDARSRIHFEFELKRVEFFMRPFEKLIRLAIKDGAERTVRNIKGLVERER